MTRETAQAVQQTAARLEEAQANARRLEEATLAQIAAEMPERVDELAKRYAHEQPDVTQELGREKLGEMRAELAAEARSIGAQFVAAIDQIAWPTGARSSSGAVHSALFDRFFRKVSGPAEILERYGYKVRQSPYADMGGVIAPQQLYRQNSFGDLAAALKDLGAARTAHDAAVAADKRASVEDLWG